jgi:hypothetical protein
MRDLAIRLENRPGALAEMGEALGAAGVSVEGGGAFVVAGEGSAHFLFEDGIAARKALEEKGITVLADKEVLIQKLNQDQPGQLGRISRMMAEAGVNIEVIYSDHQNQLILVVDDFEKGQAVSELWKQGGAQQTQTEGEKPNNAVTNATEK